MLRPYEFGAGQPEYLECKVNTIDQEIVFNHEKSVSVCTIFKAKKYTIYSPTIIQCTRVYASKFDDATTKYISVSRETLNGYTQC